MRKFYDVNAADGSGGLHEEVVTAVSPIDVETELKSMKGAFVTSLTRGNKDIKADRALSIAQKAKRAYRRKIEDIMDDIKEMKLKRRAALDLSPNDRNSLVLANNFDADDFVKSNLDLGKSIENQEIVLRIATTEYEYLFGEKITY